MKKIVFVDNFDSFSFILVDYLSQCGAQVEVINNTMPYHHLLQDPELSGIVLSPGPATPSESGNLMQIVQDFHEVCPILGVCLGHQALGMYWGLELKHARKPLHGKSSTIQFVSHNLFADIQDPLIVGRYHSLCLETPQNKTFSCRVIAHSNEGEIMAIEHTQYAHCGVQFHPESVLTPQGMKLINNWLNLIIEKPFRVDPNETKKKTLL